MHSAPSKERVKSPHIALIRLPLTKNKIYELEEASIDFMDAELQLLLAVTWEHEQGEGLTRLQELCGSVEERVEQFPNVFESEYDRTIAVWQILDALQELKRIGAGTTRSSASLSDWSISPVGLDLPRLHREIRAPYRISYILVHEAKISIEARVPRSNVVSELRKRIRFLGEYERFPFHVSALAACIMTVASRPGRIFQLELEAKVANYERAVERLISDAGRIKRMELVDEFLSSAKNVRLKIDQSYSWSDLARYSTKRTSLKALGTYTQLNYHGYVSDARFSKHRVKTPILSDELFHKHFTIWFLRASTLMFSGDDRETRVLRRSIVHSERADVRVYGKPVLDSLVMLVPLDDDTHDIERQLALLLMRLDKTWRSRHMEPEESADFLEKLPESLKGIVISHGMRRKVASSKKTVLYCLAGLIAENIYKYRHHNKEFLEREGIRTRADVDEFVAKEIHKRGFQYNAETLRRRRAKWRREFLDRVPEIFGIDDF